MIDKKTFKRAIAVPLERAGFVKKGQSWYLNGKDTIIVVNLQKCDWDELYFINIGIWLKAFGEESFPQDNKCHLSYRAESLFPNQRELILLGSNLVKSDIQMLAALSEFISNQLVPFLQECTDESKLRDLMSRGVMDRGLVRMEARMYLSRED
jgi:Domain of unknown function (DUF4304)